jgi:small-conductance mechanosensitive channel
MNPTDLTYYWWIVVGVLTAALTMLFIRKTAPAEVREALRFPAWCVAVAVVAALADAFLSSLAPPGALSSPLGLSVCLWRWGGCRCWPFSMPGLPRRLGLTAERIFRDIIQGIVYAAVGLLALSWLGVQLTSLLVTSALFTAIIGLALQDTLGNILAGLTLQAQQPFEVGDWIQLGDGQRVGEVVEINWRAVRIFTLDREQVTIPNSLLAKSQIVTYTKPSSLARQKSLRAGPLRHSAGAGTGGHSGGNTGHPGDLLRPTTVRGPYLLFWRMRPSGMSSATSLRTSAGAKPLPAWYATGCGMPLTGQQSSCRYL